MVVIVGFVSFIEIIKIGSTFEIVEKETTPAITSLSNIKSDLLILVLETNEFILELTDEHVEEFEGAKEALRNDLLEYKNSEGKLEEEQISKFYASTKKIIFVAEDIFQAKEKEIPTEILLEKLKALDQTVEELFFEIDEEI